MPAPRTPSAYFAGRRAGLRWLRFDLHGLLERPRLAGLRVGEQDAQVGLALFAGDQLIGLRGLLDREALRDQRAHVQAPGSQQVDERLQVATFRPAHVAERVILPLFLVSRVIAPRSIGARVDECQLFLVVDLARDVQPYCAYSDHPPPVPGDGACQLHGV